MTVWIDTELCNGCKRCVKACPYEGVEIRDGKAHILERCTSCGACIETCKQKAILTDAKPREIPDFSDWRGVWVFAEQRGGKLHSVSLELLGKARELAHDLGQSVSAVLLGDSVLNLSDDLIHHGANRVYLVEDDALSRYRAMAYTAVLEKLIEKYKPSILLMGATHIGRDLAPRLSRRVAVGLTADCTELTIDPEEKILLQTRPAFGGNVMATIANRYSRPQMATVRPGVCESGVPPRQSRRDAAPTLKVPLNPPLLKGDGMEAVLQKDKTGDVIRESVAIHEADMGTKVLEIVQEAKKGGDLGKAKIIVAGGRGAGDRDGFQVLEKLARALGGEVAGTRVAVEEGWISADRQVGQTGQSVRPELYIACGISGAIQHRAGMVNARYIVAINRDERAPIFQVADWRIVGDMHELVPEMIRQLEGETNA